MSFCRVVRAFLHCGQRRLLTTRTGQTHSLNWPPTFLCVLLDYDFSSETTLPHRHMLLLYLNAHAVALNSLRKNKQTKNVFVQFSFPSNNHVFNSHNIHNYRCAAPFLTLLPRIYGWTGICTLCLLPLGSEKKKKHFMFTHQHIGPHLLHKAAMWSYPVILTHSRWVAG